MGVSPVSSVVMCTSLHLQHHCRNCGGIYCFACSENALQLASSSKPVRVCDSCYTLLLERSST